MKKLFVPYELSVKLKELGFDELCLTSYTKSGLFIHPFDIKSELEEDNVILDSLYLKNSEIHFDYVSAPLWEQAFDWFREKYNIYSYINITNIQGEISYHVNICSVNKHEIGLSRVVLANLFDFETYEEARQACLEKLIEIVNR